MPGLFLEKQRDGSVNHVGEPTAYAEVATRVVTDGIAQGYIVGEDEQVVHRPGGPPHDPWRITHTFRHFSHLVIAGVRYVVIHQPDKYADPGDDDTPVGEPDGDIYSTGATRVDWFYGIELEGPSDG
jgi:hypothetical protein